MSDHDDPFAGLDGAGSGPVREPRIGWRSDAARAAFWIVAGGGAVLLCAGWFWYGFAFFEEMTEHCKSLAAGSSETGFGLVVGGIPVALVHILVLVSLLLIGANYHSRRTVGLVLALVAVTVASALGIAANQLLWTGQLFTMSAAHAGCDVIDP